jgi:hypothetical protein
MCEGGEGGIREEKEYGGGIHFGGIHSCIGREREILGALGDRVKFDSGIYSAPGLRGFGLGGLGRPLMS